MPHETDETQGPMNASVSIALCEGWTVTLYMGGSVNAVKDLLARRAAEHGVCWSVEPTEFIYSGGRELGVVVRQIAYARFPSSLVSAMADMLALGEWLMRETGQGSFSVVGPAESVFVSRRKGA